MRKAFLFLSLLLALSNPLEASFARKITCVIDHSQVPSNQSNFTVVLVVTNTELKQASGGAGQYMQNASAYDTGVSDDGGSTFTVPFEIDSYDAAAGTLRLWVLRSSLSASVDGTFIVGFGDPALNTNPSSTSAWGSQYVLVQHLPDGATLTALDSTINALNGTLLNSPTATTGQIDGGGNFVAASSQAIGRASGMPTSWTTFSFSAWFQTISTGTQIIFDSGQAAFFQPILIIANVGTFHIDLTHRNAANNPFSSAIVAANKRYYVKVTRNGASATVHLYNLTDGTSVHQTITIDTAAAMVSDGGYYIGRVDNGAYFDGMIDNVVIANIDDTQNQTDAEYNNQSNPTAGGFYVSVTFSSNAGGTSISSLPLLGVN